VTPGQLDRRAPRHRRGARPRLPTSGRRHRQLHGV